MRLHEYIEENTKEILDRVTSTTPVLLPENEIPPHFPALRTPYLGQARVIEAARRTLTRQPAVFVVGEMGTGKTLIGSLIPRNGTKTIIMCPSHLTQKWVREIVETRPNAKAVIIRNLRDAQRAISEKPAPGHTLFYAISKEAAKLSYYWKPAYNSKRIKSIIFNQETKESEVGHLELAKCPACGAPAITKDAKGNEFYIAPERLERVKIKCSKCKSPLWSADNGRDKLGNITRPVPRKISLAEYLKHYARRHFDYLIIDEAHELKAADSAQGNALGALAAISTKKILLTGTLIGGYATHLYYLLWRVLPHQMRAYGFEYYRPQPFISQYGVREQIIRSYESDGISNRGSRGSSNRTPWTERPGISPRLFPDFLLGNAIFLQLDDLSAELPLLTETPIEISMSGTQQKLYDHLESELRRILAPQLAQGNKALLSKMLINLLAWPDKPFGNSAIELGKAGFLQTPNMPESRNPLPKEQRLIEITQEAKNRGSKTLVYVQFTSSRDIQPRLAQQLEEAGLKTAILRSKIKPEKREQWIKDNAAETDVLICNPEIVKTGLDLYDYTTIVFFQTGYNIFTLRQASRRAWRLGQKQECRTYFLYYAGTMQHRAIDLIATKLKSSTALDGKLTDEGLTQLAQEDDAFILAKAFMEGIEISSQNKITFGAPLGNKDLDISASQPVLPTPQIDITEIEPAPAAAPVTVEAPVNTPETVTTPQIEKIPMKERLHDRTRITDEHRNQQHRQFLTSLLSEAAYTREQIVIEMEKVFCRNSQPDQEIYDYNATAFNFLLHNAEIIEKDGFYINSASYFGRDDLDMMDRITTILAQRPEKIGDLKRQLPLDPTMLYIRHLLIQMEFEDTISGYTDEEDQSYYYKLIRKPNIQPSPPPAPAIVETPEKAEHDHPAFEQLADTLHKTISEKPKLTPAQLSGITGSDINMTLALLMYLELAGNIKQLPGKRFADKDYTEPATTPENVKSLDYYRELKRELTEKPNKKTRTRKQHETAQISLF